MRRYKNMNSIILTGGLSGLQSVLVQNWIGPVFLIIIAGLSVKFMMQRQFRELAGFLVIGAIVGVLIYGTGTLFGADGLLTKIANGFANLISPESTGTGGGGVGNFINLFGLFK